MGEAMGSGFARLLSCEPALGVEGLGPWVCGGDSAPFFRILPCGAGPKRCAAFEGPATQGPNRRLGLFVRHRNQQGKRSLRSGRPDRVNQQGGIDVFDLRGLWEVVRHKRKKNCLVLSFLCR